MTSKSTHDKARFINFDTKAYGAFAEIGAGQETARLFFIVGGASKTIAKTISAYDMTFSDAIYGPEKNNRYVCESRLQKMLNHEYSLVVERLENKKSDSLFFAFANTVAARSSRGIEDGHGWIGVRFQPYPKASPHDIVIHVNMLDPRNILQQEALGIVGVNLIYGAFVYQNKPEKLVESLVDGFDYKRIEIDMIRLCGPEFKNVDNHILNLHLVQKNITNTVVFDQSGDIVQANELLFQKDVAILRGRFRPFTKVHLDIIESGINQFAQEPEVEKNKITPLCELTLNSLMAQEKLDINDFLHRVETITANKIAVMVTNLKRYFELRAYFEDFNKCKFRLLMGTAHLKDIFDETLYADLQGGILEALGDMFKGNSKIFTYPMKEKESVLTLKNFVPPKNLKNIFNHFIESKNLQDIETFNKELLNIRTDQIVEQIRSKNKVWEDQVPNETIQVIKAKKLFGY